MARSKRVARGQLGFWDRRSLDRIVEQDLSAQEFRAQLATVHAHLRDAAGLSDESAATEVRHVAAMVRRSKHTDVRAWLEDIECIAEDVRRAVTSKTRGERFRAACDAAAALLPDPEAHDFQETLRARFPGRVRGNWSFLDVDLGGATHPVHPRMYPDWNDGDRLIATALAASRPRTALRDTTLVALHVRSSLTPGAVASLRWEDLRSVLDSDEEIARVALPWRGRTHPFALHRDAIDWLRSLHLSQGEHGSGPVFVTSGGPGVQMSD